MELEFTFYKIKNGLAVVSVDECGEQYVFPGGQTDNTKYGIIPAPSLVYPVDQPFWYFANKEKNVPQNYLNRISEGKFDNKTSDGVPGTSLPNLPVPLMK